MSHKCPYCQKELYIVGDNFGDLHIVGNDDNDEMEINKPESQLDRGKVLAYIESISYTDDFGDWFLVPDLLTEEINSGRLDVEES